MSDKPVATIDELSCLEDDLETTLFLLNDCDPSSSLQPFRKEMKDLAEDCENLRVKFSAFVEKVRKYRGHLRVEMGYYD